MTELTETLKASLSDLLEGQVEVVPIPTHGDRMVKLRTLQEALAEFDSENTVHYLIQIKTPAQKAAPTPIPHEPSLDLRGTRSRASTTSTSPTASSTCPTFSATRRSCSARAKPRWPAISTRPS